jgi:signal transduction histidine kinase
MCLHRREGDRAGEAYGQAGGRRRTPDMHPWGVREYGWVNQLKTKTKWDDVATVVAPPLADCSENDEFLANVSHELRTPIATILTLTEVLLDSEPFDRSTDALGRLLGHVQREVERMETLVDDLLEFTRLQTGRVRLRRDLWDLTEIARRAVNAIEPLAATRGQKVYLRGPECPVLTFVDGARIERAVLNLLNNAHKYSRDGGHIRVTVDPCAREAVLTVADDGPGIPEADWERVFERYYRSSSEASRRIQGNGLGLPIARTVVELHGGRISVESPPGCGAIFRIRLPRREPWRRDYPAG